MGHVREITEGARKLREHLSATDQTVPEFCEAHGLCRIQVQRLLKGERKRVSVDMAKAIRIATDGAVPTEAWSTDTLRAVA